MKIGFVGLGNMGKEMATNLIKAGHDLTVHDIRKDPMEELAEVGAKAVNSPKDVAQASDIICLCLPKAEISEQVVLDPENGVLTGARKGSIIIELSTVLPSTVKMLAKAAQEKGVEVVDAPVSGGHWGAAAATLAVMVGGKKEAVQKCRPVLEAIGREISYVGDVGAGELAKLVNNLCSIGNTGIALEAIALGAKVGKATGVSLKTIHEIVKEATGGSRQWNELIPRMIAGDTGCTIEILYKDALLIETLAREHKVPVSVFQARLGRLAYFVTQVGSRADRAEELRQIEKLLGVQIRV